MRRTATRKSGQIYPTYRHILQKIEHLIAVIILNRLYNYYY